MCAFHAARDAEIRDVRGPLRIDDDVGRLQIPVEHAGVMRVLHREGHAAQTFSCHPRRQWQVACGIIPPISSIPSLITTNDDGFGRIRLKFNEK
jgi:hypothetical protein